MALAVCMSGTRHQAQKTRYDPYRIQPTPVCDGLEIEEFLFLKQKNNVIFRPTDYRTYSPRHQ